VKRKALVIGCGKIGAQYDLENDDIQTHAKALFESEYFNLSFYDTKSDLSSLIATRYKGNCLSELKSIPPGIFDLVSICSPTAQHKEQLEFFLRLNTPVIICEKPISYSVTDLDEIEQYASNSHARVLVNYIRSFQPAFISFKKSFSEYLNSMTLQEVVVKYTGGFLNNASHAFDLLEFLLDERLALTKITHSSSVPDRFTNDPTRSFSAEWNNFRIHLIGLTGIEYPIFTIELYYLDHGILITNSGDTIKLVRYKENNSIPIFQADGCIKNYMRPVVQRAIECFYPGTSTNFSNSLRLNRNMLDIIDGATVKSS